jgi:hypothetical protein
MDYKTTIKERLNILPEELRDFVLSDSWRIDAQSIAKEFGLEEDVYAIFENEIFLVLTAFNPLSAFTENVQRELSLDSETSKWLGEDVEKYIFKNVANILEAIEIELDSRESKEKPANNIGNSFEQIILNQAIAMQPARPAEPVSGSLNPEAGILGKKDQAPENLPIEDSNQNLSTPNYSGNDPYREPIE